MTFWIRRKPKAGRCFAQPVVESIESRQLLSASGSLFSAPVSSTAPTVAPASHSIVTTRAVVAAKPVVNASAAGGLTLSVSAGRVTFPNGTSVVVNATSLTLAGLTTVHRDLVATAPANIPITSTPGPWDFQSRQLVPANTHGVVGGLYHTVIPNSVVVKNSAGVTLTKGTHYLLNADWGQVVNLNSGLGTPGVASFKVSFDTVLQRLDLIQVLPNGTLKVKRGVPAASCPVLPTPDAGAVGLAGIHVNTLDGAVRTGFSIKQRDIYPIASAAPVAPINVNALAKTRAKLIAKTPVNIAWLGDSVTWGAEAGDYWVDRSQSYTTRVVNGLKSRFIGSKITETAAYQPGISAEQAADLFNSQVLAPSAVGKKIDLLVIALGLNNIGNSSLASMTTALTSYIRKAKAAGMDVLLVTPLDAAPYASPNPSGATARSIAIAIKNLALAENVACADVNTEWRNQATRGVAPLSQLHNSNNHPGISGMQIYANTILRLFPA